jgi:threonine dehydratase
LRSGKLGLPPRAKIATLICGAGSNGIGMDGQ